MKNHYKVLFVEDDPRQITEIQNKIKNIELGENRNITAKFASTYMQAITYLNRFKFDFAIIDVHLKNVENGGKRDNLGLTLVKKCREKKMVVSLVSMDSNYERYAKSSSAMGANFYFQKKSNFSHIKSSIDMAILTLENELLQRYFYENFISKDNNLKDEVIKVLSLLEKKLIIIICGEHGTGRDYIAQSLIKFWGLKPIFIEPWEIPSLNMVHNKSASVVKDADTFSPKKLDKLFSIFDNIVECGALIFIVKCNPDKFIANFRDHKYLENTAILLNVPSIKVGSNYRSTRRNDIPLYIDKFLGNIDKNNILIKKIAKLYDFKSIEDIKKLCGHLKEKCHPIYSKKRIDEKLKNNVFSQTKSQIPLRDSSGNLIIGSVIKILKENHGNANMAAKKIGITSTYLRYFIKKNNISGFFRIYRTKPKNSMA